MLICEIINEECFQVSVYNKRTIKSVISVMAINVMHCIRLSVCLSVASVSVYSVEGVISVLIYVNICVYRL